MTDGLRSHILYHKALGCLLGGLIGDAMGTPAEGKRYEDIERLYGWISDFSTDGTDDTVMKNLLSEALTRTNGYATMDEWAQVWLDNWDAIFSDKLAKFFHSVIHTAHKLKRHATPRMAALGNMPSSSTAMCISPVGIVNACNPRQAALQAYNLAALIHIHDVGFCQDGAAAMAAGVAEAFKPRATFQSVVEMALDCIMPISGAEMVELIRYVLKIAKTEGEYRAFRAAVYRDSERLFRRIPCDSRETIPISFSLFQLAEGDMEKCVTYGANFGRDADTIATMCGALAGALCGDAGISPEWVKKAKLFSKVDQEQLAEKLVGAALSKSEQERHASQLLEEISRRAE